MKKAQEQKYYQQINNYQIAKYSTEEADKAIAEKAISVLKTDLANGFDHIVMARCKSIKRAKEVFKYMSNIRSLLLLLFIVVCVMEFLL